MNKIKFIAGTFGVFAVLLSGVAFAQVATTTPANPPVPVSQRYALIRGAVTAVSAGSVTFTGLGNCQPSVLQMLMMSSATTTPGCTTSAYTIAQDQILVISGDDKIVPQNSFIRLGTKGNLYLKDGQPYMLRVTGEVNEPRMCTMEAKQCSDGSFVGRTGPNCEFAMCPGTATSTATSATVGICVKTTDDNGQVKVDCRKVPPGLRRGMQGEDVKHIQELLREKGFLSGDSITGFFGPTTMGAVQKMQQMMGLPNTGLVGPMTIQKLEGQDN